MVFSSSEFLFAFLPAALVLYFVCPGRLHNAALLLASLAFYTWGGGVFVGLLLGSIAVNYGLGLLAGRPDARLRRICVGASVAVNLGILGTFKYANFAVEQWNAALGGLGFTGVAWTAIALPIGISFFTFQSMSYVFDVARARTAALRNPIDFALYVAMFPQLIAGPIVRFHEISDRIRERRSRLSDVSEGALRFSFGLAKKVIVADSVGLVADAAFGAPAASLSAGEAWLGVLAYTLQIYFDFSAYSDMAIGLGRVFGFRLPENFDRPYSALSVTDFWRRWHITLSNWFRDYLYIQLGGSRRGPVRTMANLVSVFLLVGLWHGASWTFVLWGAYHGSLLIAERVLGRRYLETAPNPVAQRVVTLLLVMLGWVVFRADDAVHAFGYYAALLGMGSPVTGDPVLELTNKTALALGLASLVFCVPRDLNFGAAIEFGEGRGLGLARAALLALALPYAGILIMSGTYSPFLYFRF
jgi:alginate O-acetyltransferase complex protein AlgI